MSMTTGDELGKSDMFMKFAVSLFPLAEEAVRQGMTLKEFEGGMLGGLLSTGKLLTDRFLVSQGDGNLGETIMHPTAGGGSPEPDEGHETRMIHRSPEPAVRFLRTVFGEHEFSAYVYRDGENRRDPIVLRPIDERLGISPDRYSPLLCCAFL